MRFSFGIHTIKRLESLEKKHNVKKSVILRIAIDLLFAKKSVMNKKDFLACVNKEYMRYLIRYTKMDSKSRNKMIASLRNIHLRVEL